MFEQLAASFGSGFFGIISGAVITFVIFRERVNNLCAIHADDRETTRKRLDAHDIALQEITARKHCGPCDKLDDERRIHADERHEQVVMWMSGVQKTLDNINDLLRTRA